jgi:hypothetical protein
MRNFDPSWKPPSRVRCTGTDLSPVFEDCYESSVYEIPAEIENAEVWDTERGLDALDIATNNLKEDRPEGEWKIRGWGAWNEYEDCVEELSREDKVLF